MVFVSRRAGYGTELARTLLGWEPRTDLETGMELTREWLQATGMLAAGSGA